MKSEVFRWKMDMPTTRYAMVVIVITHLMCLIPHTKCSVIRGYHLNNSLASFHVIWPIAILPRQFRSQLKISCITRVYRHYPDRPPNFFVYLTWNFVYYFFYKKLRVNLDDSSDTPKLRFQTHQEILSGRHPSNYQVVGSKDWATIKQQYQVFANNKPQ